MAMQKVSSLEHLKELAFRANGDFVHFYLFLANGLCRSGKRLSYRPDESEQWLIINEIDESFQELEEERLSKETLLIEGLNQGALFQSEMP